MGQQRAPDGGDDVGRQLGQRHAAGQARGQLLGRHLRHPRRQLAREDRRDLLRAQLALEQPVARVAVLERLGEQLVEQEHLDAALAHEVDERVELLAGPAHPDHVVEQQLVAVRRRQALVRQVRAVDDDAAQRPDLGGDAELGGGGRGCHGFSSQLRTAAPPTNRQLTTKASGDEGPDELQVAVVADLGEGEAAHDHRGGRGEQVHEAGRRLVGGHGHRARHVGEVGQRGQDRHHERGVPGRRRHEERDRDVHDQRDHAEHALGGARDRVLHPVQDGVGHVGVLHDHGDPAGEHDDQRGPQEVRRRRR